MVEQDIEKMVMYHYTNPISWIRMNYGDQYNQYQDPATGEWVDGRNIRGLCPRRSFIRQGNSTLRVPAEATHPAIFGLTHPTPESWVNYDDEQNVFDDLIRCCSSLSIFPTNKAVLLRVDLLPEDNPIVVDYVHRRTLLKETNAAKTITSKIEIEAEAGRRYWESRVPLAEYGGGYTLPEVVVFNPIPLERVHFKWEKDLKEYLAEVHGRIPVVAREVTRPA